MRIRFRYTKTGRVRFISHLDDVRVWERAVRRAGLPLAYTEGFSPRPKLHFGQALATCYSSSAEYLDLDLSEDFEATAAMDALTGALPEGMDVIAASPVDTRSPALAAVVCAAEYLVPLREGPDTANLRAEVARLLGADSLPHVLTKKGKQVPVDVREGILALGLADDGPPRTAGVPETVLAAWSDAPTLWCRLATQPRNVRPAEVLAVMTGDPVEALFHRTAQLTLREDGTYAEPLALGELAELHSGSRPQGAGQWSAS